MDRSTDRPTPAAIPAAAPSTERWVSRPGRPRWPTVTLATPGRRERTVGLSWLGLAR